MNNLTYHQSKKSLKRERIKSGVISTVSIVMGCYSFLSGYYLVSVVFWLLLSLGVFLFLKSYQKRVTVTVNEQGLISDVNGMGLIPWDHIEGFEIVDGVNVRCLVVKVKNEKQLLESVGGISKKLMSSNINRMGSPVVIPESQFDDNLAGVRNEMEAYKDSLHQNLNSI